MPISPLL